MSSTLASVRNALQVLLVLRRRGPQRLNDIAAEVGVGTSTAHRLVATLRAEGLRDAGSRHAPVRVRTGPAECIPPYRVGSRMPPTARTDAVRPRLELLTPAAEATPVHSRWIDGRTVDVAATTPVGV